jgi:hypothetical protein
MASLASARWITVVGAVVGGISLGYGLGTIPRHGVTMGGIFFTLAGLIILWWALSDRRKMQPGTPESEAGGSHTME